jgi:hypothetical protein
MKAMMFSRTSSQSPSSSGTPLLLALIAPTVFSASRQQENTR